MSRARRDDADDDADGDSVFTEQDRAGIDAIRRRLDAEFGEAASGIDADDVTADRDPAPRRARWTSLIGAVALGCIVGSLATVLYVKTVKSPTISARPRATVPAIAPPPVGSPAVMPPASRAMPAAPPANTAPPGRIESGSRNETAAMKDNAAGARPLNAPALPPRQRRDDGRRPPLSSELGRQAPVVREVPQAN